MMISLESKAYISCKCMFISCKRMYFLCKCMYIHSFLVDMQYVIHAVLPLNTRIQALNVMCTLCDKLFSLLAMRINTFYTEYKRKCNIPIIHSNYEWETLIITTLMCRQHFNKSIFPFFYIVFDRKNVYTVCCICWNNQNFLLLPPHRQITIKSTAFKHLHT